MNYLHVLRETELRIDVNTQTTGETVIVCVSAMSARALQFYFSCVHQVSSDWLPKLLKYTG